MARRSWQMLGKPGEWGWECGFCVSRQGMEHASRVPRGPHACPRGVALEGVGAWIPAASINQGSKSSQSRFPLALTLSLPVVPTAARTLSPAAEGAEAVSTLEGALGTTAHTFGLLELR